MILDIEIHLIYFVLLAFVISVAIGWRAIPNIVIIAKTKRLFDKPSLRKVHSDNVPRLGGISFFPTMMIAFCFALGLRYYFGLSINIEDERQFLIEFLLLNSGLFMLYMIGMADDLIGVGYKSKFWVQLAAATILVFSGLYIRYPEGLLGITDMGVIGGGALTIVLIIFAINAFNLIYGVDGLCSGIGIISLGAFAGWFIASQEYVYAMLAFSMIGVLIVFFLFNVLGKRLKVFMGDTGSLTLGFLISFIALKFYTVASAEVASVNTIDLESPLSMIVGVLFVPLFDTARVFVSRISRGKSPFHPDKNHIHHKLLALGFSHLTSTAILLLSTIGILILNIILSQMLKYNVNIVLFIDVAIGVMVNIAINRVLHIRAENEEIGK